MQPTAISRSLFITATTFAALTFSANAFAANIFGSAVPSTKVDIDKAGVELGVKFQSSVGGKITGVRFYRGVEDSSGYVVRLWSSTGTSLAQKTVAATAGAGAGWREVTFATPVTIAAGTTYVASYFAAHGGYGATPSGLASAVKSGSLTALASGGVYRYASASAFPSTTYQATNYFVDVAFTGTTTAAPAAAPAISFTASPTSVAPGGSSTLTWSSRNATSCTGSGFSTGGALKGTAAVAPTATKSYWITCSGSTSTTTATTVTVAGVSSPAPAPAPSTVRVPGPSAALFKTNPYYSCVTNRYVATAANGGSDNNNGTQATNQGGGNGPWLTIQKAAQSSPSAGWCINIGAGTYNASGINITKGGNTASATGFVVYRASSLLGAKLVASNSGDNIFNVSAPYVIFDGLELSGENRATAGINTCMGGPSYNGIHHITVMNSYIHNMNENGIATCWGEYYRVINNRLDGNASASWNSGVSTYQPIVIPGYVETAYDKTWAPYRNIYAYNRAYNNFTSPAGGPHTDGNGIIYDDTRHTQSAPTVTYAPKALLMGNITWGNGGAGIQVGPTSANADVFNNTAYNNYLDTNNSGTWRGELSSSQTTGVTFKNNIAYAVPSSGILSNNTPYLGGNPAGTNTWQNNIAFGANPNMTSPNTFSSTANKVNTNPRFVSPAAGNFALCTGVGTPSSACTAASPGIGYGVVVPYWQQQTAGSIDLGACPRGLSACP